MRTAGVGVLARCIRCGQVKFKGVVSVYKKIKGSGLEFFMYDDIDYTSWCKEVGIESV